MPALLREGRCTLAAVFGAFKVLLGKAPPPQGYQWHDQSRVSVYGCSTNSLSFQYQVCYCYILLGTVLILFWHGTKPSEGTYVYVDILLNILPPMLFGTTQPYKKLVPRMPFRSILSIVPQVSMYSFIVVQVAIYYFVSRSLTQQPW